MNDKFIDCVKCGKHLIQRLPNGIFSFKFGKGKERGKTPVELLIYGSIKMKCIRRSCQHWNVIDFFPPPVFDMFESQSDGPNDVKSPGGEILRNDH